MRLRSFWHFNTPTYLVVDYCLQWVAVVCAFTLSPSYHAEIFDGPWLNSELRLVGFGMPLFMVVGLQLADVQRYRPKFRAMETLVRAASGVSVGMLAFVLVHAMLEFTLVGRYVLLFSLIYGTAFVLGSRMVFWRLAEHESRRVLFYGNQETFQRLLITLRHANLPVTPLGCVNLSTFAPADAVEFERWGRIELMRYSRSLDATEIVVEITDALSRVEREALMECTRQGIVVTDLNLFSERELERVHVARLQESWFWSYDPRYSHPGFFAFKRLCDVVLSSLGLLLFAPLAPLVAFLVKISDRGPVIYSQVRVGYKNLPFKIYKFRTMRVDAEHAGPRWAALGDARVTWIGRWLRRTRIDEVPQFWNILRGEMSFIGPRPERPEFVELIEREVPFYSYRHLIKPGLSGWAQINYPYGASVEESRQKLAFDLYYLKHASITLDLLICLRTLVAMAKGAR